MQSSSEIHAILLVGATSMHSLPIRTTGHDRLHSCRHFFGLHLSAFTMAIRVSLSLDDMAARRKRGGGEKAGDAGQSGC